jgi:hypothetical protein
VIGGFKVSERFRNVVIKTNEFLLASSGDTGKNPSSLLPGSALGATSHGTSNYEQSSSSSSSSTRVGVLAERPLESKKAKFTLTYQSIQFYLKFKMQNAI